MRTEKENCAVRTPALYPPFSLWEKGWGRGRSGSDVDKTLSPTPFQREREGKIEVSGGGEAESVFPRLPRQTDLYCSRPLKNKKGDCHASQTYVNFSHVGHGSFATGHGNCFRRTWCTESSGVIQWAGLGKVDIDARRIRAVAIHAPGVAVAWRRGNRGTPGRHIGTARTADACRRAANYLRNDHCDRSSVARFLPTRRV
jgi:hypothetical protein